MTSVSQRLPPKPSASNKTIWCRQFLTPTLFISLKNKLPTQVVPWSTTSGGIFSPSEQWNWTCPSCLRIWAKKDQYKTLEKVLCSRSVWFWLFLVFDYDSWNMSRGILERTENKIESTNCPLRSVWQSVCGFTRFEHIGSSELFNLVFRTTRRGLPVSSCEVMSIGLKHRRTHTHTFLKKHHPIVPTVLSIHVYDI